MVESRRGRLPGLCVLALLAASAACQVLAGIDEKTAAAVVPDAAPDVVTGPECTTNAECIAAHANGYVCVKETGKCQSLFSSECDTVLAGNLGSTTDKQAIYANDDTLLLGFIMDLKGAGKTTGIARRQAVALAIDAITNNHGIPGGTGGRRRPVAVIACSETKDDGTDDPKVPARHLIDDLHVPAIIGATNSDSTVELFFNAALPNTLVFAPNALSSRLSTPTDNGLFWRTSAADPAQARALQQQIESMYDEIVNVRQTAQDRQANLAIVYLKNGFGQDIVPQILDGVMWNGERITPQTPTCTDPSGCGSNHVLVLGYDDTTDGGLDNTAYQVAFFKPSLVVAVGGADAIDVARRLETSTLPLPAAPSYLFAQGSATPDLTTILTGSLTDAGGLAPRIRGVRQLLASDLATFTTAYAGQFPGTIPDTLGVPGAYDITFLLSYAAVAASTTADAGTRPTGAQLVDGLRRVLDPAASPVDRTFRTTQDDVTRATDAIVAGGTINVKGYSYTQNFDLDAGEAPSKFDLFCVDAGLHAIVPSGALFDPAAGDAGLIVGDAGCF